MPRIKPMINQLKINNFKSIKQVDLPCKKINVFIGEPNGGKSNIIEALSLMSQGVVGSEISKEVIRYKSIGDLFFDFNINKPIEVLTDKINYTIKYAFHGNGIPENQFDFELIDSLSKNQSAQNTIKIAHDGKVANPGRIIETIFRYYQYKRLNTFQAGYTPHLAAPFGENLPSLLLSNEDYKNWVSEFFESKGFILTLKPSENEINMSKFVNKSIYGYQYFAISETLQRIVFYIMAIKSNKESVLLFDEPESNTFPFYTKYLAERIALDETNQFFLTTHNPYMLLSLIEKSKSEDINVCVVRMKDFETEVSVLNTEQIEEVLDLNVDAFLNLDRILS
jgi:AAA15 family ATPase/GTPase